jgi:hypothetical protein
VASVILRGLLIRKSGGTGMTENSAADSEADRRREWLIRRWALSPYWSLLEGVALAYNLDPNEAKELSPTGYGSPRIRSSKEAQHLLDLAYRASDVGQLDHEPTPAAFIKWARSMRVEFHPDWWSAIKDNPVPAEPEVKAPAPAPELAVREQESLLKMVIGMAIGGYSWNPRAARNSATTDIADDLARAGVPLDADTVRKWLKKGAELLPGEDA